MAQKFKAINDGIIVQLMEKAAPHEGQIVMPDNLTPDKIADGVILSAGGGFSLANGKPQPLKVKVGDKIKFRLDYAKEKEIDKGVFALSERDVLAVVEE